MSFTQFKFERSTYQTRGIFNTYVYETDDPYEEVFSSGYFSKCRFLNEPGWDGGYLDVICSDGRFFAQISGESLRTTSDYAGQIIVRLPEDLQNIDSTKVYFIDGVVDFTGSGLSIEIPGTGFTFVGHGSDISSIKCKPDFQACYSSRFIRFNQR